MKHRKQLIPLALVGVFVAAALCGCGQQDTAASETQTSDTKDTQTAVTPKSYTMQQTDTGAYTISIDGKKVVGGADKLDCVGDVDIAAAFDTTQGASEQLEPILTSLFNLRLGYDAEKPDYTAGISNVADMEVSFMGTDGEETDYIFAKDGQYYVVWFQNKNMTAGEQRSALATLKAGITIDETACLLTPDMPGWTDMDRGQRVETARQLPPAANPFLIDVYAYDSVQEGVQQVSAEFPELAGALEALI